MSWWVLPTTADIGVVAFAPSAARVMEEAAIGLQGILLSDEAAKHLDAHVRHTSQWSVEADEGREDLTLVRWLEEVRYQCEVHGRFIVDSQVKLSGDSLDAQVSWVDADLVEREVEVKAITRHELRCEAVDDGVLVDDIHPDVPAFEGPGWMAAVIFDI